MPRKKKQLYCSLEGCNEPFYCRGYCHKHYANLYRYGNPREREEREYSVFVLRKMRSYYGVYHSMVNRCTLPSDKGYPNYGGRGITVCERWLGEDGLKHFIEDMGLRPDETKEPGGKAKWSIERIDNNKGYCPENCI